jgi:hypothetical protein
MSSKLTNAAVQLLCLLEGESEMDANKQGGKA